MGEGELAHGLRMGVGCLVGGGSLRLSAIVSRRNTDMGHWQGHATNILT
jgi:hypothetical protein